MAVLLSVTLSGLAASAITLKQDYVYVAGGGNVTAIRAGDGSVGATIGGIVTNLGNIAASPDGKKVYVSGRDCVYVINTSTNTAARKDLGLGYCYGIAANPVLNEYYVGVHATRADNYRPFILVLNANTDAEVMRFNTSSDGTAMNLAVSPDGDKLYVCFQSSMWANFTVYDLSSRAYLSTRSIFLPSDIAVRPDGKEVYVACDDTENLASRVYVINATSFVVKAQLDYLQGPRGVAFSPDGKKAFITNRYRDYVTVLDTSSRSVVRNVSLGRASPNKVAVTPDGKKAFVSHSGGINGVSVIDLADYSVSYIGLNSTFLGEMAVCTVPATSAIAPIPVTAIPPLVLSPTPTPTPTPTTEPSPAPTGVPPAPTAAAPTPTPIVTPSPTPGAIPPAANATESPTASAAPSPSATPGFEALAIIASLAGAAYLARRP